MQRAAYSTSTCIVTGATFFLSVAAIVEVINDREFSTAVPGMRIVGRESSIYTILWLLVLVIILLILGALYTAVRAENAQECTASGRELACQAQRNNLRFIGFLLLGVLASIVFASLALLNVVATRYYLLILGSLSSPIIFLYISSTTAYAHLPRMPRI